MVMSNAAFAGIKANGLDWRGTVITNGAGNAIGRLRDKGILCPDDVRSLQHHVRALGCGFKQLADKLGADNVRSDELDAIEWMLDEDLVALAAHYQDEYPDQDPVESLLVEFTAHANVLYDMADFHRYIVK